MWIGQPDGAVDQPGADAYRSLAQAQKALRAQRTFWTLSPTNPS